MFTSFLIKFTYLCLWQVYYVFSSCLFPRIWPFWGLVIVRNKLTTGFLCVCPLIDDKFCHNIVKVYCRTTHLQLVVPQPLWQCYDATGAPCFVVIWLNWPRRVWGELPTRKIPRALLIILMTDIKANGIKMCSSEIIQFRFKWKKNVSSRTCTWNWTYKCPSHCPSKHLSSELSLLDSCLLNKWEILVNEDQIS